MKTSKAIAMRISKLLHERKMSQYRLELNSGILHGTMGSIMMEKSNSVGINLIIQIARGFNMTLVEFFDDPLFDMDNLDIQ